jgi:glycine dehydrogenase
VLLARALRRLGYTLDHEHFFDTVSVRMTPWKADRVIEAARSRQINLRRLTTDRIVVALDETVTIGDLADVITCFALDRTLPFMLDAEQVPELKSRALLRAAS